MLWLSTSTLSLVKLLDCPDYGAEGAMVPGFQHFRDLKFYNMYVYFFFIVATKNTINLNLEFAKYNHINLIYQYFNVKPKKHNYKNAYCGY